MIFVVFSISLIFSLFYVLVEFSLRGMLEVSRCRVFSGSLIPFVVFFLLIPILYLLVLLGILSGLGLFVVLKGDLLKVFIRDYCMYYTCYSVRDGFDTVLGMVAFEVEVLFCVCWFVIDICEDLAIYDFYKDV